MQDSPKFFEFQDRRLSDLRILMRKPLQKFRTMHLRETIYRGGVGVAM
jgi:hypothetical protein